MLILQDLINRFQYENEIYIIGTGPSLRVFPSEYFANKFTIGLNFAWEYLKCSLNITIHPNCIPVDYKYFDSSPWLTKIKKSESNWQKHELASNLNKFYYFKNTPEWGVVENPPQTPLESLYCGRGIQTSAMHLAAILGQSNATTVYMVGCDCSDLAGDHHFNQSYVQFHNLNSNQVYKEYFFYLVKCRELLEKTYNVKFFNLSRLQGEGTCREDDYIRQREQLGLEQYPKPKEIETNKRDTPLVTDFL